MAEHDGVGREAENFADPTALDFESFTRYAQGRTHELAPDIDVDAMAFVLTLHRAASTVVYDIESSVHRPAGWSWAGFRLLFVLWLAGPLEAKHAARLSGLSRQSTSILANTLERDGLLERSQQSHDRRIVSYGLTKSGLDSISSTYEEHNRREQLWASVLEPDERAVVTRALNKILAAAPSLDVRRHHD